MDKLLIRGLMAVALCLMAAPAAAADFDYDWVSAGMLNMYPGQGLIAHGWFLDGSAAVAPDFTVEGNFYRSELNGCPPVVSVPNQLQTFGCVAQASNSETYRLGGGWHRPVAEDADLLVDAYYAHGQSHQSSSIVDFLPLPLGAVCPAPTVTVKGRCESSSTQDSSGGGYLVDAGLRVRCGCTVEFRGFLGRQHLGETGTANFVSGEASYAFTGHWVALFAMSHLSTPQNQYRLGLRYRF